MLYPNAIELRERYPQALVDKVLRVREMYNWFIANPDGSDREFVAEVCQRHGIHRTMAYSDLAVVKSLQPMLGSASRDFHRWRTNEMLIAKQDGILRNTERKLSTLKMSSLGTQTSKKTSYSPPLQGR